MTTRRFRNSIFLTVLGLLLAVPVAGQTVLPPAYQVVLDSNGDPVSGAQVEVYQAGTVIAAPTYADAALAVPNPWPIVADSAGRFVAFVPSGQSFKVIYKDAAGAVLKTVDGVAAIPSSTGNLDILGVAGEALLAGDVVYLSDGSGGLVAGQWYKADADNTYSSTLPTVGMVPAALAANATGTIRLAGRVEDLPAMVVGSTYYISATAGDMTAVAPANARLLGSADTATSLVLQINTAAPTVPISALTGALTAVAYDAADFTNSGGGTWVVEAADLATFAYRLIGKSMFVVFDIRNSTTTAVMGSELRIEIPGGFTANRTVTGFIRYQDNGGAAAIGYAQVTAAGTVIACKRIDATAWAVSANNTGIHGVIEFEIQ
jgi:hypothetical protein